MHLNRPCKLPALFATCTQLSYLKPLKAQLIVVNGFFKQDTVVGNFIRRCVDLGDPKPALSTLSRINPTLFLQNLTIRCLHDHELYQDVLAVYKFCHSSNCPSDNFTFPFVIKACSALNEIRNGKEIHCVVLRTGFDQNVVVQTSLVDFYAKIGEIGIARKVHDEMPQPDMVSWNALLSGYSLHGLNHEVFEVFGRIRLANLNPNESTFASLIPVCSRLKDLRIGKSFHGLVFKCGYFNDFLIPAFISMYGSKNELSVARDIFDNYVPKKNVTMWNAMISAYSQSLKPYDAILLFRKMILDHIKPNMITFMSIIPSCDIAASIDYFESLHSYVIKLGLQNQPGIATVVLSLYAKFRHLNSAEFLFDHMTKRTLLTWNAMVSGYVYNECWIMGLAAFRGMQADGVQPDVVSIISILSACSALKATHLGQSAHSFSLRTGMDSNLNLSNALLAFYTNCRKMSYSFRLFERMVAKDDVSWNTLISGCARNGEDKNAILLVQIMQKKGVKFDSVTFISVLPCFKNLENLVQGMAVHGCAIKLGFEFDVSLANTLISMYMNCGELDSGKMVFDEIPVKDVVSWNAMITGYHIHRREKEGIDLFARMVNDDCRPNLVTLLNVLPMCFTGMQVKSIHAYAARRWNIMVETSFITSLISVYGRFSEVKSSNFLFQMAEKGDVSVWNAIVAACVESDNAKMAIGLFSDLLQTEVQPDYITIVSLTSACGQLNRMNFMNLVMGYVIQTGFDKYVEVSNAFIDLHARSGNISYAKKVFDEMPVRDIITWSTMINGYGLHGNSEAALDLFTQMRDSGFHPDETTYISILSACSHAGLVDRGRMVFESMLKDEKFLPRMEHYACMVDLLGRTGHLKEAYDVVKRLPFEPSISILESLLGSCLNHGDLEVGKQIGRLIIETDVTNSATYVMLYNVYAAAGMWSEANEVRSCMEAKNLKKLRGFSFILGQR